MAQTFRGSSVQFRRVWMPKAACEQGGVERQLPIEAMAHNIMSLCAE